MLLGFLLSILSATFSLVSTTELEASGDLPAGATYTYARNADSGQKGQMTAGHSTCLTLTGWTGCRITSISLQMRSNTASGTGSLAATIGKDTVWEICNQTFDHADWNGAYSANWVTIQHPIDHMVEAGEPITIVISATENSLYISSYTLTYQPAAPRAYTVQFATGLDTMPAAITQAEIGAPVVLPEWIDTLGWYFIGWSAEQVLPGQACPATLPARSSFTPVEDTRLWAIYTDNNDHYATQDYLSGDYTITQINQLTQYVSGTDMAWAMYGKITDGEIALKTMAMTYDSDSVLQLHQDISSDMVYTLQFAADSTLYIQNTKTAEFIGYQAGSLASKETAWKYRVLQDGSLAIYYSYNQKTYALWMGFGAQGTNATACAYAQQIALDTWTKDGYWLFPAILSNYTSWPTGQWNDIKNTEMQSPLYPEYIMPFGPYYLEIKAGKKFLRRTH